jgi:glycosyltransferase involved in cell wall biosynthesis
VDALADCLRRLAADPAYRRRLGGAARQKVLTKHLWVHNAQAVLDLIERQTGSFIANSVRAPRATGNEKTGNRAIG